MGEVVETPAYEPMTDGFASLRRLGSETVHLAAVDPLWFVAIKWLGPSYWAIHEPTVTLCGAVLRPDHRGLVAMRDAKKVCTRCERKRHG